MKGSAYLNEVEDEAEEDETTVRSVAKGEV